MWIGTSGQGLFRFNPQTENIENFNEKSGLTSDIICKILEDDDHNLWVSTNNGIFREQITAERKIYFQQFTTYDGIHDNSFYENSGFKDSIGKLYFGGDRGYTCFNPANITQNTFKPPIHFNYIQINNRDNAKSRLLEHISTSGNKHGKKLVLKHTDYQFFVKFSALSFFNPGSNLYTYKLAGFDPDWNIVTAENRTASYSTLPPGDYTFMVKARNADGIWNEKTANIEIKVLPAWWQTIVFKTSMLVLAVVIFMLLLLSTKKKERIKKERELERVKLTNALNLNRFKINFFTNLAHEIRTPLSLIKSPMEVLMHDKRLNPHLLPDIEVALKNTNRLSNLINQLLEFRKIEESKYKLTVGKHNIIDIIDDIIVRFSPYAKESNIHIQLNKDQSEFWIDIDFEAITKSISNLMSNAVKYASSAITIYVTKLDDNIKITIEDDGPGIPADKINFVFEPYQQLSNSKKGIGIGLTFANSLIELHNGVLTIENKRKKSGVRAIIILPIKNEQLANNYRWEYAKDKQTPQTLGDNLQKKNSIIKTPIENNDEYILIAEDNTDLRNYLERILNTNYKTKAFDNGKEALEYLSNCELDPLLIITDIMMPKMTGIEFCSEIKSNINYSHIPIVMLTAKNTEEDMVKGIGTGAEVYLSKPFSVRVLKAHIENILITRKKIHDYFSTKPYFDLARISQNQKDSELINKLIEIIEENIEDPNLSVVTLASEMHMSQHTLYKKVKAISGQAPNDYIKTIKLRKAAELLANMNLTMNDIAIKCGFNSLSYFSSAFKKQFDTTPTLFRKNLK